MSPRERLEAARIGPEPMTRIVYADDLDGVLAALRGGGKDDEPPEDDFDNVDYMRGWTDAKADSVDPRSTRPCPGCVRGYEPVMLDADGTLCSVSGEPGRPGHGLDDAYWFCEDFAGPLPPAAPAEEER